MAQKLRIMTKLSSYKAYIDSTKVCKMEDAKRLEEVKSNHSHLIKLTFFERRLQT